MAKRVLVISALQVYPTLSGGNLRTYSLANALLRRGFEVSVFSFVGRKSEYLARTGSAPQSWPSGVEEYVWRSPVSFLAGYGSYWFGLPPIWITALTRLAQRFRAHWLLPSHLVEAMRSSDIVVSDFPFVSPMLDLQMPNSFLRVLNLHNVEHHLLDASGSLRERLLRSAVRRIELAAANKADLVVCCSDADQTFFRRDAAPKSTMVVPNGIDVNRFLYAPDVRDRTRLSLGLEHDTKLFLFTASRWGPNLDAYEFLRAAARRHEAELLAAKVHILVVGGVTAEAVREPAFSATGAVAAVEPFFAAADAALNPITQGAGTNVKMGEFIAARLPVVTTGFGARGFNVRSEHTGFVAERTQFIASILRVASLLASEPRRLRDMCDLAFQENLALIDMYECVAELSEVLRSVAFTQNRNPTP